MCHIRRPKLKGQFSENLVSWIYEFVFNSGDRTFTEKKIVEVQRAKISQVFSTY